MCIIITFLVSEEKFLKIIIMLLADVLAVSEMPIVSWSLLSNQKGKSIIKCLKKV